MLDFLMSATSGLIDLPWWGYVLVLLGTTHITIATVTIFLHRTQAHRGIDLHPVVSHFFRAWLWLTTGMVTKEWVSIHRKHHAKCDTVDDPHSPVIHGHWGVLRFGVDMYRKESKNLDTLERYGHGTPDDWVERNVYSKYTWQGMGVSLVVFVALFGFVGLSMWCIQLIWIPITAAGIINGTGHHWVTAITRLRMRQPTSCRGASSSAVKSCTTITTRSVLRRGFRIAGTSLTLAGCTSARCRRSVWLKSAKSHRH